MVAERFGQSQREWSPGPIKLGDRVQFVETNLLLHMFKLRFPGTDFPRFALRVGQERLEFGALLASTACRVWSGEVAWLCWLGSCFGFKEGASFLEPV